MDIADFPTAAPDDYVARLYHFESDNGRAPDTPGSQYQGLAQLGREERQRYNVTDPNDPVQVRRAVDGIYARNAAQFYDRFGRLPTDPESYLMHNQGVGGLSNMLRHPDAFTVINPGGNTPWAHGHTAGMTNSDWVTGWTNHWNGAPQSPQSPSQPQHAMADQDVYGDLLQRLSRPQQAQLSDGLWPYLTDNTGGLNRLERVGLWMQSLQNPNALAQLGAANREAEQRNQMMLHLLQAKQSDDYRRAMLGLSMNRLGDAEAPKDINGNKVIPSAGSASPMWAPPGSVPSGPGSAPSAPGPSSATPPAPVPSAGPTAPTERPLWMPPAGGTSSLEGLPQVAMGDTDLPVPGLMAFDDSSRAAARGGPPAPPGRPNGRMPTQEEVDATASAIAAARRGKSPISEEAALSGFDDPYMRQIVEGWGQGAYNPDLRNTVYSPLERAGHQLAVAIWGEDAIKDAYQANTNYKAAIDPKAPNSPINRLAQARKVFANLFVDDPNATDPDEGKALTHRYDEMKNEQYNSRGIAYGWHPFPQNSILGSIGWPGENSHWGETGDAASSFNNGVNRYQTEATKLRVMSGAGSKEERGADQGAEGEPKRGAFDEHMQPNEFRKSLNDEVTQHIADLEADKDKAVNSVGGPNTLAGQKLGAMYEQVMAEGKQQMRAWNADHPTQRSLGWGEFAKERLFTGVPENNPSWGRPATPLGILNRIKNGGP